MESLKMEDQIDLLREQQKILSGEVAFHSSALKRLLEEVAQNPEKERTHVEIRRLNDEIMVKNQQIASLEKQIAAAIMASCNKIDTSELSQSFSELMAQLNEKSFELEVKTADNRIIQEQLNQKICECEALEETIASLKQQFSDASEVSSSSQQVVNSQHYTEGRRLEGELFTSRGRKDFRDEYEELLLQNQAAQIEELNQNVKELTMAKEQLETRNQKLAEESSYAKGLASAAAVELKALSEEVAKLMNKNERLSADMAASKHSPGQRRGSVPARNGKRDGVVKRNEQGGYQADMKRELTMSQEREQSYEAALLEKERRETELQMKVEESKEREAYLENELANMWVLVAKLKKSQGSGSDDSDSRKGSQRVENLE